MLCHITAYFGISGSFSLMIFDDEQEKDSILRMRLG